MQLSDITVEVRDKDLKRRGLIPHHLLTIQCSIPHNNVGTWTLNLPSEHPLADELGVPGSGIIVTGPDGTIFSGPVVKPLYTATSSDPMGSMIFDGVTDEIVLADMLAWPDPSNATVETQANEFDTRSGNAEDVIHAFVNANIGPSAPYPRKRNLLTMGANLHRGPTVIKSARFQVLGELIGEVALMANLGFRVIQRGEALAFETYQIVDRTSTVRLDVRNGTLSAQKLAVSAPEVTRVVSIGKGEEPELETDPVVRKLLGRHSTESEAAEALWGRRIERVVSKTSTNDNAELNQASDELLAENGFTNVAVEIVPMDAETMQFGKDWGVGDRVSVVVADVEYSSVVTGFAMRIDTDGFALTSTVGNPKVFNPAVALRHRVANLGTRLSALERTA